MSLFLSFAVAVFIKLKKENNRNKKLEVVKFGGIIWFIAKLVGSRAWLDLERAVVVGRFEHGGPSHLSSCDRGGRCDRRSEGSGRRSGRARSLVMVVDDPSAR